MFASTSEQVDTIRKPRSAYLLIDSKDRAQISSQDPLNNLLAYYTGGAGQPINNFVIQKRQTFMSGFFHRIALTEARFEYNSPNVNPRNNILGVYDALGNEVNVDIDEGFYTPDELATELELRLQALIPAQTWLVSFTTTYQFQITSNATFVLFAHPYPTLAQSLQGLFFMMGFTEFNTVASIIQQGSIFPSMTYTRYIDICSRNLTQYQKSKDNSTRENQAPAVLARLYLSNYGSEGVGTGDATAKQIWPGCAPAVIYRFFNVPKYSSWSPGAFIDQIDIELRDDAGNLLYIPGPYTDEVKNATRSTNNFQLTFHCSES
jgi:hypothetical protein